MELVLGLATIATAISGATGAGRYSDVSAIVKAEPETVHVTDNLHHPEIQESIYDLPESHFADFASVNPFVTESIPSADYYDEVTTDNDNIWGAQNIGQYMNRNTWSFTNYDSGSGPSISSVEIHGNIDDEYGIDWYTFTLYGKADVTIDLGRIPLDCDYDLELYKLVNSRSAGVFQTRIIGSSYYSWNSDEHISKTGL